MKAIQLRGPFSMSEEGSAEISRQLEALLSKDKPNNFIQIGIEIGASIPYQINMTPVIKVKTAENYFTELKIGETCVIEWDAFTLDAIKIIPLQFLDEYTIIDLIVE
jgi:hypothetical protein